MNKNQGHINQFANDFSFGGKTDKGYRYYNGPFAPAINLLGSILTPPKPVMAFNTNYPGGNTVTNYTNNVSNPPNLVRTGTSGNFGLAAYGPPSPTGVAGASPTNIVGNGGGGGGSNTQVSAPQTSGGNPQSEADQAAAAYNPLIDYYNQLENDYQVGGQQYNNAESALKGQYGALMPAVQNRASEQNAALDTQNTDINNRQTNALAQARQLYNELSQGNIARFGGGSSAGPAAQEILGRATSQQFGQIGQTAETGYQAITQERNKIANFVNEKKASIEAEQAAAVNQLQSQFRDKLNAIQQSRAQTETAKAQARLDVLGQYRQMAMNIQSAAATAQIQLQQWQAAKIQGLQNIAGFSVNPNIGVGTQFGAFNIPIVNNAPVQQTGGEFNQVGTQNSIKPPKLINGQWTTNY